MTSFIPDVFVIGAMKAGTSTLWKAFFNNPSITPSESKEVNYFLKDHTLVEYESLYKSQFRAEEAIKVDISPNYSRRHLYGGVAKRIHYIKPNAKILYLIRNPIDRIISHLHHDLFRDRLEPEHIESALATNEDYLKTSKYFFQIEEYLNYFDKQQILILPLELLKMDPAKFSTQLSEFLNLKDVSVNGKAYNVSERRYRIKYHDQVHQQISNTLVLKLYHYFWYFVGLKVDRPQLSSKLIQEILLELEPDKVKLTSAFGSDIGKWL
jgi:hypothetical protein